MTPERDSQTEKSMPPENLPDDWTVTVCSACERACCWQGESMCDYADMAGTKSITIKDARDNPRGEHPSYWLKDVDIAERLPQ